MDCPGAVSVSASKAVLKFAKSVTVDTSETVALPALVKKAYRTGGASIPIVILVDPGMKKIYGTFNHPKMKTQKYGEIFKQAREDIRKAKKGGTFDLGENAPVIVKVEDSVMSEWQSSKGSVIKAKLVGVEDDKIYLFETANGKTIRATAAQLNADSVKKARKAAGLEEK